MIAQCWCGNADLLPFSPQYLRCPACETLVTARMPAPEFTAVKDDERDFYGRKYWFSHQEQDLGFTNITLRARADLPERCLHWLRVLLKYKLPPGNALELGCAHGGFVALMRWAGFQATGLELSPWVVDFARRAFDIPMLLGPIEDQQIAPGSLDVIALMDVLEHLPDPAGTMRRCLELLTPEGILLIQTPCYAEGATYDEMVAQSAPFLEQLKHEQHLYLFSRRSIRELFRRLGAEQIAFEPAIFERYDMFLATSRAPLSTTAPEEIERRLSASSGGRMAQALLDLDGQLHYLQKKYEILEADHRDRISIIQRLNAQFAAVEKDRAVRLEVINKLNAQFAAVEKDRAVRLEVINKLNAQFAAVEKDRATRLEMINQLNARLAAVEKDRAARLGVINQLNNQVVQLNNQVTALTEVQEQLLNQVFIKVLRRLKIVKTAGKHGAN
jgi:2-polyprenyl-3-methyl-5-hydroxy-6-metoxy-1,4-benzoquinol methylase